MLCASDAFYYYRVFCFYICYHRKNYIILMMILMNLGLTTDPMVCNIFALFHCVLTSLLLSLVFWGLMFFTNRSRVQRWLTPCIILALKFLVLPPVKKHSFIVIVWFCTYNVSSRCIFPKIWSKAIQWETSVLLTTLLAEVHILAPLFSALMVETPQSTNFGVGILTGYARRFIWQRV